MTDYIFRAFWPIVDDSYSYESMCQDATRELPTVAAVAGARLTGKGQFSIVDSASVPGSGRTTATVLLYQGPATRVDKRAYRRRHLKSVPA